MTNPPTIADLCAALTAAGRKPYPDQRARALMDLQNTATAAIAAAIDAAVVEATQVYGRRDTAMRLDLGTDEVGRRVTAHNTRTGTPGRRGRPTRTTIRCTATTDTERQQQLRQWVTKYGMFRATTGHPQTEADGIRMMRYVLVIDQDLMDRDGPVAALDNGAILALEIPDPDGTLRQRAEAGVMAAIDQAAGQVLRVTLEDLVDGADRPRVTPQFDPWAVESLDQQPAD
ncbi:hypothetical protein [Micromonospora sp. RL09-050-HVF-A]|uniref:hypothetical protein n=1 Tax=Micromonospora sp. RL09-050-HVF-A TaxID=1703433 RepID=UPI001C601BAD|nr:hypothetical protein [Micromonospora sp. RL09-050-HVF-A]MBW4700327.1 hypothetical protein [Micromonospora sp. RL09-050-HVF-A]